MLGVESPLARAGDTSDAGSIPGLSGRSPGVETGSPLQQPCLEDSMDRGAVLSELVRLRSQMLEPVCRSLCFRPLPSFMTRATLSKPLVSGEWTVAASAPWAGTRGVLHAVCAAPGSQEVRTVRGPVLQNTDVLSFSHLFPLFKDFGQTEKKKIVFCPFCSHAFHYPLISSLLSWKQCRL